MINEEYKENESVEGSSERIIMANMSHSESESEMEEEPQNMEQIESVKNDFEHHLEECLEAIRSEEMDGIVYGINNLSEALSAHPEYSIEALDDTIILTLICIFLEQYDDTLTSNTMRILHILLDQFRQKRKEESKEENKNKDNSPTDQNIFIEVGILNNFDNSLRNQKTPIPILYAIDIVNFMTEFMEIFPETYSIFISRGFVTTILDIVNSKCPERIPDRPDSDPEFCITYREETIDMTDNEDKLIAQCLRFLNLFLINRDVYASGCIIEAIDYLVVFPFIERYPIAAEAALQCLVKFTELTSNPKLEYLEKAFKSMEKIHPLMDLAFNASEDAWLCIDNLLSGGYLIDEFYGQYNFVDLINSTLTQTFDVIREINSSEDPSEEDKERRNNASHVHYLAMTALGAGTYDKASSKYVSLFTESQCLDIIMEDILESTMKVRKEACIALANLFDSGEDSIIQYLFEKNNQFPLQALQNLSALNENEQEAVINALTHLIEALTKNGIMNTIDSIGGTEGMEIIDEFLDQAPANIYPAILQLKNAIISGQPDEGES